MINEWELKRQIVEIGKRIWTRNFVAANDGNITVKLNDRELLTTPTGVSKGFMTTDMILKVDLTGKVMSGSAGYKPSSELKMHLEVYKERPDVKSVVHAHPPFATSFAVAGIPLNKCVLPEAILVIGAVPTAKYGLPSTMEIPDSIREHIKNSDVILLENHGALTLGTDVLNAYHKMETLEHTASIISKAIQLGNLNVLPAYERDRLLALRDNYGLQGRFTMCDATPMPSNERQLVEVEDISHGNKRDVSEQTIKDITQKVLAKLKQQ
jgi:L-fuculose-phosphate aldolase